MKSLVLAASMLALAAAAEARQAIDHSHMHDTAAGAQAPAPAPAAPQAPAPGQPPAPPGGGGRGGPQIDVPWNDAIPPGTADHAMRALKESSRHGEWATSRWRMRRAQELGGLSRTRTEGRRRPRHPRHPRDVRHGPRARRPVGAGRLHRLVPDFLSGKGPNGGGTESLGSDVGKTIQGLTPADVAGRLNAAMDTGRAAGLERQDRRRRLLLGRRASFGYAAAQPALNAAVIYYGDAPGSADSSRRPRWPREGAGARALRRQRCAHQHDGAADRSGDEEARQELRGAYLRRGRTRFHVLAGRRGWRQPQGRAGIWPVALQFFKKNLQ